VLVREKFSKKLAVLEQFFGKNLQFNLTKPGKTFAIARWLQARLAAGRKNLCALEWSQAPMDDMLL
jgi:hypothetical protein